MAEQTVDIRYQDFKALEKDFSPRLRKEDIEAQILDDWKNGIPAVVQKPVKADGVKYAKGDDFPAPKRNQGGNIRLIEHGYLVPKSLVALAPGKAEIEAKGQAIHDAWAGLNMARNREGKLLSDVQRIKTQLAAEKANYKKAQAEVKEQTGNLDELLKGVDLEKLD